MAQASAEKLEHTGPAENKKVALVRQREHLASTPEPLCQKEKKQSRLSRVPDHYLGKSKDEREPHLGEREGDQGGSMERKEEALEWMKADSKEVRESKQEEPP